MCESSLVHAGFQTDDQDFRKTSNQSEFDMETVHSAAIIVVKPRPLHGIALSMLRAALSAK